MIFSCPICSRQYDANAFQGVQKFHCACGQKVAVPQPPSNKTVLGKVEDLPTLTTYPVAQLAPPDFVDYDAETPAAKICNILSVVLGSIGFVFCPLVFSLAGIILGVVGMNLSKLSYLGMVGTILSSASFGVGVLVILFESVRISNMLR